MIEKAEKATRNWLEQVVIDLNFCPFAKKPFLDNSMAKASPMPEDAPVIKMVFPCNFTRQK